MEAEQVKYQMIEENPQDEQSNGFTLWEKAKNKIRAIQSFLKIQNDKRKESLLSKRKNPFTEEEQNDEILEQEINKKQKGENEKIIVKINIDGYDNYNSNLNIDGKNQTQMEVLDCAEGSQNSELNYEYERKQQNQQMEPELNERHIKKYTSHKKNNQQNIQENDISNKSNSLLDKAFIENSMNEDEQNQKNEVNISKISILNAINEDEQENIDDQERFNKIDIIQNGDDDKQSSNKDQELENNEEDEQNRKNSQSDDLDDFDDFNKNDSEEDKELEDKLDFDKDEEIDQDEDKDEDKDKESDQDDDKENDEDEDNYDDDNEDDNNIENTQRNQEDMLVKNESIYITEAIIDEEEINNGSNIQNQVEKENNIQFNLDENENIITIKICNREYKIDLKQESVKNNKKLLNIVNEITDLVEYLRIKQNEKIEELKKITDHNQFTALEYYLMKTMDDIFKQEKNIQDQKWQEEICCICQCDLFDQIDNYTQQDFLKQLQTQSDEDPINLEHCDNHFFHKCCLQMMIQSTHIKCPVCSKIYGVMIGDQSPGTMKIYLDKYTTCEGYPNNSTIVIEMRMDSTQKNGVYVPQTTRVGYLPNTSEARTILEMFKRAFKRRLLYTIGKSVTTGKDNRIIWNGVHFKTNNYGGKISYDQNQQQSNIFLNYKGSSNFGYPDPTYFQRVTQELALKGIYPKH